MVFMLPISTAMMAEVAGLYRARTGIHKDDASSAGFSLAMRLAISFSLMALGWTLRGIGLATDAVHSPQPPAAVWRLGAVSLVVGPPIALAALLAIAQCPLSRSNAEVLARKPSFFELP